MDAVEHVAQSSGQVTQVPLIDTVELGHDVEGMQDPEWADIEEELQDRQVVEVLIQVEHEESHSKISLITLFKAGLMLATTYADMSRWSWQILLIRTTHHCTALHTAHFRANILPDTLGK